jgi:hypothetical protein
VKLGEIKKNGQTVSEETIMSKNLITTCLQVFSRQIFLSEGGFYNQPKNSLPRHKQVFVVFLVPHFCRV